MRFIWYEFRRDLGAIVGREVSEDEARSVRRWLVGHNTIQERWCSEEMADDRRKRVEAREKSIEADLAAFFGPQLASFNGDPRGATVKLMKPATEHRFTYFGSDWGGNFIFTGGG
jgi:hypothetical protein